MWTSNWKQFITLKKGEGKRCNVCAALDEERRRAINPEDKQRVVNQKHMHIDSVNTDRAVHVRGNLLAEQDALRPTVDGVNQLLRLSIDGMDQAHYKAARTFAASADLEKRWRPTLHVTGVNAHGHHEYHFIMGPEQAKGWQHGEHRCCKGSCCVLR